MKLFYSALVGITMLGLAAATGCRGAMDCTYLPPPSKPAFFPRHAAAPEPQVKTVFGIETTIYAAKPAKSTPASRPSQPAGQRAPERRREVSGAVVYRLGAGASTNSRAVSLRASYSPRTRIWPCAPIFACPPPPPPRATGPNRGPGCPSIAGTAGGVATPSAPATAECTARACEWVAPVNGLCATIAGVGACYTLSQDEAAAGPEVIVPAGGAPEKLPDQPAADRILPVPADSAAIGDSAARESEEPAAAPQPAGADAPTSEISTAPASAAVTPEPLDMPPVFREGATEAAAQDILATGSAPESEPIEPIELPPEL